MKFDIDFILSIFVSQTLFAAIVNLVDLIKTIFNAFISRSFTFKSFFCKYSIYLSPFISFMFFFLIGTMTSIVLSSMRYRSRCEIELEKRKKRQEIVEELNKTEKENISETEKILMKYLALTGTLMDLH